jgi:hypothetical protein
LRSFVKRRFSPPPILRACYFLLGAVQIAALLVAFERPAQAYIDPGSGFVFLQVVGSMFAGAVYYLRHRLKRVFTFRRSAQLALPAGDQVEVAEPQS